MSCEAAQKRATFYRNLLKKDALMERCWQRLGRIWTGRRLENWGALEMLNQYADRLPEYLTGLLKRLTTFVLLRARVPAKFWSRIFRLVPYIPVSALSQCRCVNGTRNTSYLKAALHQNVEKLESLRDKNLGSKGETRPATLSAAADLKPFKNANELVLRCLPAKHLGSWKWIPKS